MSRRLAVALVFVAGVRALGQAAPADTVSLCEVAKNPSAFDGKVVTVEAEFKTDHIERSLLIMNGWGCAVVPYEQVGAVGKEAFDDASGLLTPLHLESRITARSLVSSTSPESLKCA